MASERITAHCGVDGDRDDACWLELDGRYLLGELRPKSHAQGLADRLNAAFDKTEAAARLAWTTDKPTKPGLYAYRRRPDSTTGDVRRIETDSDGKLWLDYGCAGDLPLAEHEDCYWLGPLSEIETGARDE